MHASAAWHSRSQSVHVPVRLRRRKGNQRVDQATAVHDGGAHHEMHPHQPIARPCWRLPRASANTETRLVPHDSFRDIEPHPRRHCYQMNDQQTRALVGAPSWLGPSANKQVGSAQQRALPPHERNQVRSPVLLQLPGPRHSSSGSSNASQRDRLIEVQRRQPAAGARTVGGESRLPARGRVSHAVAGRR